MVPVGFSQVDSDIMAPSTICHHALSPSQPLSVAPSNMEIQPAWSLKSMGSGWRNPPPPRPRPGPAGAPAGGVPGGGCCDLDGSLKRKRTELRMRIFGIFMRLPFELNAGFGERETTQASMRLSQKRGIVNGRKRR